MKFCKKRHLTYTGLSGIITSTDYILLEDVIEFHGKPFANKWLEFIKDKAKLHVDEIEGFYYSNYEHAARQTDSYLNPIG